MFFGSKSWHWGHSVCRRPGLLAMLVLLALLSTLYFVYGNSNMLSPYENVSAKSVDHESRGMRYESSSTRTVQTLSDAKISEANRSEGIGSVTTAPEVQRRDRKQNEEYKKGFLVWNPKCQIVDRDPLDPSIRKFVKKEKFESCGKADLLTKIIRTSNGGSILKLDQKLAKNYVGLSCCWAPIHRPLPTKIPHRQIDSEISMGSCTDFVDEVILPENAEVVLVTCKAKNTSVYENVHALLQLEKVREKLEQRRTLNGTRKLSVLILGMDNVSRLNFERSMPKTARHLKETGWAELKGYNKMGENTFPNLMAILTGLNLTRSYQACPPTQSFGLDKCPMLWYNFRNAGYVTAYGEDAINIGTFNYNKVGFVNPPTDFYLRPYILAAEKYLTPKRHLGINTYCTGPESSGDRIFNYALDFARNLISIPYFGFFWTNTMSHDNVNGVSSVDSHILGMFQRLHHEGILNDTMLIFLSDHGMRYGGIRQTVQGAYEEKLPFIYIWLPEWFKEENHEFVEALRSNERRLTSPFDVYQTLRDVLIRAGGNANQSESCPQCQSLFNPVPMERGCNDVGVTPHWCSCTAVGNGTISDEIALEAGRKIVRHIDDIAQKYKDSKGKRMCSSLKLKKVLRVSEMIDSQGRNYSTTNSNYKQFLCQLEVIPGDGKFEATMRYYGNGSLTIVDDNVSRINTYSITAECLDIGEKEYCFCA